MNCTKRISSISRFIKLLLVFTLTFAPVLLAQDADLLEEPLLLWSYQLAPVTAFNSVEVLKGNGVVIAPDGSTAIVTTVGGAVFAFDAYTGEQQWIYQPEPAGENSITRTHSGVTFSTGTGDDSFMVFSVVDNENSLSPLTRVVALDMEGNELWISDVLEGIAMGDPLISSDGGYVFLNHNVGSEEEKNGYFTVLEANATGIILFSQEFEGIDRNGTTTAAFGPPGIYHNPVEGNYDPIMAGSNSSEGDFNTNDMLMWGQMPKSLANPILDGYIFGFQFPTDFVNGENMEELQLSFFPLGRDFERDFQTLTPPVITYGGLSAYWGVSRNGFRGWVSKRFSRARNAVAGFERNEKTSGQPVFAAPTLSNDDEFPVVFGGTASNQFVRMNFDFTEIVEVPTIGYINAKALMDGNDRVVYYVEDNGMIHQANFDDLTDEWTYILPNGVDGEMAITSQSDIVIIADINGMITALKES